MATLKQKTFDLEKDSARFGDQMRAETNDFLQTNTTESEVRARVVKAVQNEFGFTDEDLAGVHSTDPKKMGRGAKAYGRIHRRWKQLPKNAKVSPQEVSKWSNMGHSLVLPNLDKALAIATKLALAENAGNGLVSPGRIQEDIVGRLKGNTAQGSLVIAEKLSRKYAKSEALRNKAKSVRGKSAGRKAETFAAMRAAAIDAAIARTVQFYGKQKGTEFGEGAQKKMREELTACFTKTHKGLGLGSKQYVK